MWYLKTSCIKQRTKQNQPSFIIWRSGYVLVLAYCCFLLSNNEDVELILSLLTVNSIVSVVQYSHLLKILFKTFECINRRNYIRYGLSVSNFQYICNNDLNMILGVTQITVYLWFMVSRVVCNYYYFLYIFWGDFSIFFVLYSTLLHLPHLRFHCADGCWDRTQDRCNLCIGSQTL
jgi:hypothetical protein